VREQGLQFSVGLDLYEYVREAILNTREQDWAPAITQQGEEREGAAVCELKDLDLSSWPPGTRAICRRERPHPGAQLKFTDVNGFRFQVFITDQEDKDIAQLEARHRGHARVENRIRCGKATGLENLPFHDFMPNCVWLELVLAAQDLIAFFQNLCLRGEAQQWDPKAAALPPVPHRGPCCPHRSSPIPQVAAELAMDPILYDVFRRLRRLEAAA